MHTGDRVTVLPSEAVGPLRCPDGLVNVPRKAAHFVGRAAELGVLEEESAEPVVVCGLGGVGKSSLVARWAAGQTPHRNPVWWITAESRADVDAGLAGLAAAMRPELVDVLPREALRERAVQWLAAHDDWLLILDNVTDPGDVEHLLARTGRGRIVLTSRAADAWYGIGRVLTLSVLSAEEGVELFTRVAAHAAPRDTAGAARLCEALGQLPLAVEIAAAYCGRTATPPLAYLEELGRGGRPGNAEEAVARTLRVTLDRLGASAPEAVSLLGLLAWFAPDRIPARLLAPLPGLRDALGELAAHSMVTLHEDGSVSVHRLVQAVARRPDPADPHRTPALVGQARRAAEAVLALAVPVGGVDPAHWETQRALLPHVEAYLRHSDPAEDGEVLFGVLAATGGYLAVHGPPEAAVEVYERLLPCAERVHGPDSPFAFAVRGSMIPLALATGRDGTVADAAELVRRTTGAVGADAKITLLARRSLAQAHRQEGRIEEAVALQSDVLADMVRVLGEDDMDTLATLLELAACHREASRVPEALDTCARARAGLGALLGEDHLLTLIGRAHLAALRAIAGETERARAECEALWPVCVRVVGEEHPLTADVAGLRARLGQGAPT
ncbi:tetratricopeptide repeat protein [Streptomyces sp. NPDC003327]